MIFIANELSDPHSHFRTNVVDGFADGNDLLLDLGEFEDKETVFERIAAHIKRHQNEKYIIYNAYKDEDFFFDLKKIFPQLVLFTLFSDDEWRHSTYDRYIALYSDFFSITSFKANIEKYKTYGFSNVLLCQWACNPNIFKPFDFLEKEIDVSFIGAAYGKRIECVQYLVDQGIDIRVYGKGWDSHHSLKSRWGGYLSSEEMVEVINKSRICLNFLWTSFNPGLTTVKGRCIELPACRSFQLASFSEELYEYGFREGETVVTFGSFEDLTSKIEHYLRREDERQIIEEKSYKFVLENHTWKLRYDAIIKRIAKPALPNTFRKPKILVIEGAKARHKIVLGDARMDLKIVSRGSETDEILKNYDGILRVDNNTNINNESLWMMSFGLISEGWQVVISNFSLRAPIIGSIWIRFRENDTGRLRRSLIPSESIMVGGGINSISKKYIWNIIRSRGASIIDYPTYLRRDMSLFRFTILCLNWGEYPFKKKLKQKMRQSKKRPKRVRNSN